jgi:hypothetical protein
VWTAPTSAYAGTPITLDGTASQGDGPLTCTWSFENQDGSTVWETATGCKISKTFTNVDTKYVRLTVKDADGDTDSNLKSFAVTTAPAAAPAPIAPTVPSGLVASYGFDEGTGTQAKDSTGHGHTGTLAGATWTAGGRHGGSLNFNGTSGYVNVPDSSAFRLTNAVTLEAWVRPTASGGWRDAILKQASGGLSYALYSEDNDGRPGGWIHSSTDQSVEPTSGLPLNTWTHIATTYDGTTLRFYVNGVLKASKKIAAPIGTGDGPLQIGGNTVWGEFFKGQIDDVRIWNRSLSATEVHSDMSVRG